MQKIAQHGYCEYESAGIFRKIFFCGKRSSKRNCNIHLRASRRPAHAEGHVQGKFLEIISSILQPKKILEIGTFVGYSALCLAKGLTKDGKLHTIELRKPDSDISLENFRRSNMADKIILHTGNALDIIPTLQENWDLVFIDADKPNYINYYDLVLPKVRAGGLIIADNVLFQ